MAYIKLDERYPDIIALFSYNKKIVKHLLSLGQEIMRGPSELTVAERELIGAYVSRRNNCEFCFRSHAACAAELMSSAVVQKVIFDQDLSILSSKMQALLAVADKTRTRDQHVISIGVEEAIKTAKRIGATDSEIHDTVLITAFFCMYNRYVYGLGTTFQAGEEIKKGLDLAKYGYTMTLRRFFNEVVPDFCKSFWKQSKV